MNIIRTILVLVFIYFLYRLVKYIVRPKNPSVNGKRHKSVPGKGEDLVEDQFCHTYIPLSQAYKKEIAGQDHYFCSKECYEGYILQKSKERQ